MFDVVVRAVALFQDSAELDLSAAGALCFYADSKRFGAAFVVAIGFIHFYTLSLSLCIKNVWFRGGGLSALLIGRTACRPLP